ncbi:MAG TPA: PLP-dependent transferase, partial [Thermoplasmataceae archaeon]|nr:PLP-dependent transferase [Thermoplasmataceae archaeon]
ESVSNPTLQVSDIRHISDIASEKGIPVVVDATFASPYNQKPLDLGASVSVHSGTKYIAGHSDVIIGVLATGEELFNRIQATRKALGGTPDPLQAFLASRGLKTLGLRMEKHNRNGMEVARFLDQHNKVKKVFYPGLESFETHNVAKKVLKGYGGMISFEVPGGTDAARKFMKNLTIAAPAPSLGGVESLVTLPVDTSHSTIPKEIRKEMGIGDGLIRFSLGIEDHEDIIEDIQSALGQL